MAKQDLATQKTKSKQPEQERTTPVLPTRPVIPGFPIPILEITDAELVSGDTCLIPLLTESREILYVEEALAVMLDIFEQCCRLNPSLGSARFVNPHGVAIHYTLEARHD